MLKRLWAKGETADAIGIRLGGLSRSAVLGKVFRLRLDTNHTASVPLAAAADSAGSGREKKAPDLARRRRSKRDRRPEPPASGRQHKTLLELTNETCRWPHGRPGTQKFFFCGAAGAALDHGVPYCARHMRRAYQTDNSTVVKVVEATA